MRHLYLSTTRYVFGAAVLVFALLPLAQAQSTATLLGVVTDESGAVVPAATLTLRSAETGQARTTASAGDGSFRFAAIPVGEYQLRVEHPGFEAYVQNGITLTVSQEATVGVALKIGAATQEVSVAADALAVDTTSSTLGGLVNQQSVVDLPLNGRNFMDLSLLETGVSHQTNKSQSVGEVGDFLSVNGAPFRSNNYTLDGAIMQNLYGDTLASVAGNTLGVDGIREFRIITSYFSAEYGLTMGSQVLIVSNSGTNKYHGDAFEFFRNNVLNARNFFDRSVAANGFQRLPPLRRNNFGGAFGGPIVKDKTFVFATMENLIQRDGQTIIDNVPAAGCHGPAGTVIKNTACSLLGTVASQTVSPVTAQLLALFPTPNLPNNQYTFPYTQPTAEHYGQIRLDQNFNTANTMFLRYTVDHSTVTLPETYAYVTEPQTSTSQYATLSESHIFSPTLLTSASFSFSRTAISLVNVSPENLSGPGYSQVPGQPLGGISISGVTALTTLGNPDFFNQNIFSGSNNWFYNHGKHSVKFGVLINGYQDFMEVTTNLAGSSTFSTFSNFLAAQVASVTAITPGSSNVRSYNYSTFGFYGQDDYKILPHLTLNLGLRYEFFTVPNEVHGNSAALRNVVTDAQTTPGPPFRQYSLKDFSPRVGFAWDVFGNGRTSVRGSFGKLYDIADIGPGLIIGTTSTPPLATSSSITKPTAFTLPVTFPASAIGKTLRTLDYNLEQPHLLQYNLSVQRQLPWNTLITAAYAGSRGLDLLRIIEGNPILPQIVNGQAYWPAAGGTRRNPNWGSMQWDTSTGNSSFNALELEAVKRFSSGLQFQVSYTWEKLLDEGQGQLGSDSSASSVYDTNPLAYSVDKARADFDVPQILHVNGVYHLPNVRSGGFLRAALRGWWVSGILTVQDGLPFTPALSSNRSNSGQGSGGAGIDRPNLNPGFTSSNITSGTTGAGCAGVPAGEQLGTPTLFFNPCAFSIQPAGYLGNSGRNILLGPGLTDLDFSVVKDTAIPRLGEGGSLQFRVEMFNILNHPNFAEPNRTVYAAVQNTEPALSTAGLITSTTTTSRQIQLALKLIF